MESPQTTTINVSLPSSLKEFVRAQIREGAYGSASEYIRMLIRDARNKVLAHEVLAHERARDARLNRALARRQTQAQVTKP